MTSNRVGARAQGAVAATVVSMRTAVRLESPGRSTKLEV
jgi:hypothetical protein